MNLTWKSHVYQLYFLQIICIKKFFKPKAIHKLILKTYKNFKTYNYERSVLKLRVLSLALDKQTYYKQNLTRERTIQ